MCLGVCTCVFRCVYVFTNAPAYLENISPRSQSPPSHGSHHPGPSPQTTAQPHQKDVHQASSARINHVFCLIISHQKLFCSVTIPGLNALAECCAVEIGVCLDPAITKTLDTAEPALGHVITEQSLFSAARRDRSDKIQPDDCVVFIGAGPSVCAAIPMHSAKRVCLSLC